VEAAITDKRCWSHYRSFTAAACDVSDLCNFNESRGTYEAVEKRFIREQTYVVLLDSVQPCTSIADHVGLMLYAIFVGFLHAANFVLARC